MIEMLIPNLWVFVGLTLVIGGLAAAVTGHALAKGWRNPRAGLCRHAAAGGWRAFFAFRAV